ncbi:MAG: hypothetical protein KI790_04820 [Cyclobacteriaceae bacterium]|nr:hypothetical protein [Cyclobacteriaceae bacterium HetDA_MAG_MS6]
MNKISTYVILVMLMLMIEGVAVGQKREKKIEDFIPTENVGGRRDDARAKVKSKQKRYKHIVKNHNGKFLYANPCALEATHKMGFEYVVQTPGLLGSLNPLGTWWTNFRTHSFLIITRTPFWKVILNSRIKKCREASGDIVG